LGEKKRAGLVVRRELLAGHIDTSVYELHTCGNASNAMHNRKKTKVKVPETSPGMPDRTD
jgi:hypothetical protein